jgi:hypothetical protein
MGGAGATTVVVARSGAGVTDTHPDSASKVDDRIKEKRMEFILTSSQSGNTTAIPGRKFPPLLVPRSG